MKLYTEEQVCKAIELARECEHECGGVYFDYTESEIIEQLTAIELPSDAEIKKESEWLDHPLERLNFQEGIKWMRDKIQGANK